MVLCSWICKVRGVVILRFLQKTGLVGGLGGRQARSEKALSCPVGFGDLYFPVLWSKRNQRWLLKQPLFSLNVEKSQ